MEPPAPFGAALRRLRDRRGISQLSLATLAGTTQRHLSFLETGRSAPQRPMVLRLAVALDLDLRETNQLLGSAGFRDAYPGSSSPHVPEVLAVLRRMVEAHDPFPAVLTRQAGDLVSANQAMDLLFEGVDPRLLAPPANVFRIALHPQGLAPRVENFPEWAAHILRNLEAQNQRHPTPLLTALLAELTPSLPPGTRSHAAAGTVAPLRLRTSLGLVELITARTSLSNSPEPDLGDHELETFLPASAADLALLTDASATRRTAASAR